MTHQEAIIRSRERQLTPPDKFESHMSRARLRDIDSRRTIFNLQTDDSEARRQSYPHIKSSTY